MSEQRSEDRVVWSMRRTADTHPVLMLDLMTVSEKGYQLLSIPVWKLLDMAARSAAWVP